MVRWTSNKGLDSIGGLKTIVKQDAATTQHRLPCAAADDSRMEYGVLRE